MEDAIMAEKNVDKMVLALVRKKMELDTGSKTKSNREAVRSYVLEGMSEALDEGFTEEVEGRIRELLDKVVPVTGGVSVPQGAKEIAGKEYVESEDVRDVALGVIKDKVVDLSGITVKYMEVHPKISTLCLARVVKAGPLVKFFGDCDVVLQVSGDYWAALSSTAKEILVYHELLHIGKEMTPKTGKMKLHIVDHNVKDFKCIIDEYGLDWVEEVYDGILNTFDEDKRDKIKPEKIKW